MFDHIVTEAIREHLPGKWWYGNPRALTLEDVSEVLEIGVTSAHNRLLQLKCGDVRSANNLVGSVHIPGGTVGLRVPDLIESDKRDEVISQRDGAVIREGGGSCAGENLGCLTSISRKFSGGP